VKIPVTEQIVKYSDTNNHATLKIAKITFLSHSDIQFWISGDCLDQDHTPKSIEATAV